MKEGQITRRTFLHATALAGAAMTVGCSSASVLNTENRLKTSEMKDNKKAFDKPNIVIITCDQLACDAIGANGNEYVNTPGIDHIFANGTSFDKTYTPYPLCTPARASFWTGQLPHQTKITSNLSTMMHNRTITIGSIFSEVGYDTYHVGKTHDAGSLRGFTVERDNLRIASNPSPAYPEHFQSEEDRVTIQKAREFLTKEHDKPFLLAVEFNNPHNINNWIGEFQGKHGDIEGMAGPLPPLRANYKNDDIQNRPEAIRYACCLQVRQEQVSEWDDRNYRQYLNAYYHYTNMADDLVGQVLLAIEHSDARDNTLVVFMSDHGDGMGSHKLVAKSSNFYDEAARVPFVLMGKGIPAGKRINSLTGLCDLLPTLCHYADIEIPKPRTEREVIFGKSMLPLLSSNKPIHEYMVSQWYTQLNNNFVPSRMFRTEDYKYTHYLNDGGEELYDMANDPGELTNLARKPEYAETLKWIRKEFHHYLETTDDHYFNEKFSFQESYRKHQEGFRNHTT
ncbi:sulfatase-like hydrolase/transferase [Endozoicomonas atrinae]|uniref:sulfatase-like hydrolase/transferase n=1 Tax=Endozoicomonas atrinae TaxID=1333660 RepID=UPI0009F5B9E4|nr:sulfatase-like hydrolase/transferase [Endozoicomonas atrinae]